MFKQHPSAPRRIATLAAACGLLLLATPGFADTLPAAARAIANAPATQGCAAPAAAATATASAPAPAGKAAP